MARTITSQLTAYKGVMYRSRTEARWAIFFESLGLKVHYEKKQILLSDNRIYLPDFYIEDFECYFEVKASNDQIVIDEASKAHTLAQMGNIVLLAIGAPSSKTPNILYLNDIIDANLTIEQALADPDFRGRIMEDRRDEDIYWFSSEQSDTGSYSVIRIISKFGNITNHERYPLIHKKVEIAYQAASTYKFE